jgi:hypothetical protein
MEKGQRWGLLQVQVWGSRRPRHRQQKPSDGEPSTSDPRIFYFDVLRAAPSPRMTRCIFSDAVTRVAAPRGSKHERRDLSPRCMIQLIVQLLPGPPR